MKKFAVLLITLSILGVLAITPEEFAAKMQAHHRECSKVSKVDPQLIAEADSGQIDESNAALMEHVFCFGKRVGLINEDGELEENIIKAYLVKQMEDETAVDKVYEPCDAIEKTDDAKLYITRMLVCYYKNTPEGIVNARRHVA